VRQAIPPALLTCEDAPLRPSPDLPGGNFSAELAGNLLGDALKAHADCRTNLGKVRELLTPPAKEISK
jgi:hypothetical protein